MKSLIELLNLEERKDAEQQEQAAKTEDKQGDSK